MAMYSGESNFEIEVKFEHDKEEPENVNIESVTITERCDVVSKLSDDATKRIERKCLEHLKNLSDGGKGKP